MSFDSSRGPPQIEGMTSLKVDNLTYRTTIGDLEHVFKKYGDLGDVYIPRDRYKQESRGFAFVRFYEKRDAEDAMDSLHGTIIDGREIRVQMAKYGRPSDPYKPRNNRYRNSAYGGGGGGGGGGARYRSRSRSPRRRSRRSRSRSPRRRSKSRSRSPRRTRYSGSRSPRKQDSRSRSRSPRRKRSHSRSRSKSGSRPRQSRSKSHSRSRSPQNKTSRSPSRSPRQRRSTTPDRTTRDRDDDVGGSMQRNQENADNDRVENNAYD